MIFRGRETQTVNQTDSQPARESDRQRENQAVGERISQTDSERMSQSDSQRENEPVRQTAMVSDRWGEASPGPGFSRAGTWSAC